LAGQATCRVSALVAVGQKKPAVQGTAVANVLFVAKQWPAWHAAHFDSALEVLPPDENLPAGHALTVPVDWPARQ
jgi:hypothetical protein